MKTLKALVLIFITSIMMLVSNLAYSQGATVGERINLGLYGGAANDLTFCPTNNRLFAAIETPASVFYTDDTCKTWIRAFPVDSLEWASGTRGWGGGATNILSNSKGWVAVQTNQQGGTLSAAVISFSEGDTTTWKTVLDRELLGTLVGPTVDANSAIALSDHWLYMTMGKYLCRYNDTTTFGVNMIIARADTIPGAPVNTDMRTIAVANTSSGFPVFVSVGDKNNNYGALYRYDVSGFSLINLPANIMVQKIFTHPAQITGDTLIASCIDTLSQQLYVYVSKNGGSSWTDVTPLHMNGFTLANADYSAAWVSQMPISNGLRINLPGAAFSDDLGASWEYFNLVNDGNATMPSDTNIVVGSMGRGVVVSYNGVNGPFVDPKNYGLSAVKVNKIAESKGVYYLSSNAGLAYTTAYMDTSVAPDNKWNPPYGQFPIPNVGDDAGISSVAIDTNDSLHIIAGYSHGFSVTTTGPAGFSNITPPDWDTHPQKDQMVTDIKFISSDTVIATTGSGMNVAQNGVITGNIWRSTDGGFNWILVTPAGLQQPNCLAVGENSVGTVIYCGTGFASGGAPDVNGELWKSTDTGLTWTKVNDGPNSIVGTDSLMPIYDIAVDPRSVDTIYIASGKNLGHAFVRSADGGVTYHYTNITGEGAFTAALVDKHHNDTVYAAIRREIYIYNAITDTYALVSRGMPGEFVPDLENGSLLAATTTGFYKIIVNNNLLDDVVSIPANDKGQEIITYPNPCSDYLNIKISTTFTKATVSLYTLTGKIVMKISSTENNITLPVKKLSPGIYLARISLDKNRITNQKIVIVAQ